MFGSIKPRPDTEQTRLAVWRLAPAAIRLAAIGAFFALTNAGFSQRILLLVDQGRFETLAGFLFIWGVALAALLLAAFQPNLGIRASWAGVIALTTAVGFSFRKASGNEFGVFDAISLWNARHEAARAMDFYASDLNLFLLVLACGFIVLATPPVPAGQNARRWLARAGWAPAVPVVLIAAIVFAKEGGGAQALPSQFAPLSVGAVSALKIATNPIPERGGVAWTWRGPFAMAAPRADSRPPDAPAASAAIRRIVLLVDESIRGDYIDWAPGNPYTPELAGLKPLISDFGPAAAGGTCSHYSNALLRFAAARNGLGRKLLANPTLWQYAKKAGLRTVFIDAQAAYNKNPGKLQNFMTREEARDIDAFHAVEEGIPTHARDDKLLDLVKEELGSGGPVFIYATKNGAHFPYDRGYPESERLFRPAMTEAQGEETPERVNSYRNVVRWSVDRFFKRLFDEIDLAGTVVLYTSDHGQAFNKGRFTHCSVENPDPREALVPLLAITGEPALRARFTAAAEASRGYASHFSVAPTLLQLFGYGAGDIADTHGASLLEKNSAEPAFTTGDIFGLFSAKVRWHRIDLGGDYLEPAARARPGLPPNLSAETAPAGRAPVR